MSGILTDDGDWHAYHLSGNELLAEDSGRYGGGSSPNWRGAIFKPCGIPDIRARSRSMAVLGGVRYLRGLGLSSACDSRMETDRKHGYHGEEDGAAVALRWPLFVRRAQSWAS